MSRQIWIFSSFKWQGNPKALFLYMKKYHADKDCYWVSDTIDQAEELVSHGITALHQDSQAGRELLSRCSVLVLENFRENYSGSLNSRATVLNLWHGVGLKHVELGVGGDSPLAKRLARKHIRHMEYFRQTHLFLATSERMEKNFSGQMRLEDDQIVRGPYPRNCVYQDKSLRSFDFEQVCGRTRSDYKKIALFAPTWRQSNVTSFFSSLLPDLRTLCLTLSQTNTLLIIKVHPFMTKDVGYREAIRKYNNHHNLVFWPDFYDIYEFFKEINLAIVDYSSIFYDLASSGVRSFIRYVPDYNEYLASEGLIDDYWSMTTGTVAKTFDALCAAIRAPLENVVDLDRLNDHFFGYCSLEHLARTEPSGLHSDIEAVISTTEAYVPSNISLPTLYSFDIFDTLLRRKTLLPLSVFERVGELIAREKSEFPPYLVENYTEVRRASERDVRAYKAASIPERGSETLEVTFDEIFERMQNVFQLSDENVARLKELEIEIEKASLEAAPEGLRRLRSLVAAGEKVILLSDMYLAKEQVRSLISAIDPILGTLEICVSSEFGHKKDSGRLFVDYFFNTDYNYREWIHFGDNKRADGSEPRRLGILALTHDCDAFLPFEAALVEARPKYSSYRVATLMHRYRWAHINAAAMTFNAKRYFAYAYLGTALGCYVSWVLKDALRRGYKTLYFVPRDGHMLKTLADEMIRVRDLPLRTKLIYGSRRAWRIPLTEEELVDDLTSPYGTMAGGRSFSEFVHASQLSRADLIETIPELRNWTDADFTDPEVRRTIVGFLVKSRLYRERVLVREKRRAKILIDYLRQEIDLSEPFSFVEFWGRGITQERLSRFLDLISGTPVLNPFYYVKSIWPDSNTSIRHRFSELPLDFAFMEPALASVSHKTIEGYHVENGIVVPTIEWQENDFQQDFIAGLRDFARDYWTQNFDDEDVLDRSLANASYNYIRTTPSDQFMCDIYGDLKDNHGMFVKLAPYAPPLEIVNIVSATTAHIPGATRSVAISLARSSTAVRNAYSKKFGMSSTSRIPEPVQRLFPALSLDRYVTFDGPARYFARRDMPIFGCVSLLESTQTGVIIPKGTVFDVLEVTWTSKATPRLLTSRGFVTANQLHVARLKAIVLRRPIPLIIDADSEEDVEPVAVCPVNVPVQIISFSEMHGNTFRVETPRGALLVSPGDYILATDTLERFVYNHVQGVIALRDLPVRQSLNLDEKSTVNPGIVVRRQRVEVQKIVWAEDGTPHLRVEGGYISAHLSDVQPARSDISNYLYETGKTIFVHKQLRIYCDTQFSRETQTNEVIKAGTILENVKVAWSADGTPRLRLRNGGYISSHLKNIRITVPTINDYLHDATKAVLLLEDLKIYRSTEFSNRNFSGQRVSAGSIVAVHSIGWSGKGVPRLYIGEGYISANSQVARRVRIDVENYLYRNGGVVVIKKPLRLYNSVQFTEETRLDKKLEAGTLIPLVSIDWSSDGTPRIAVEGGYVSASMKNLLPVRHDIESYLYRDGTTVTLKQPLRVYKSLRFNKDTKGEHILAAGTVLKAVAIRWSPDGTPRIAVDGGFVSANIKGLERVS